MERGCQDAEVWAGWHSATVVIHLSDIQLGDALGAVNSSSLYSYRLLTWAKGTSKKMGRRWRTDCEYFLVVWQTEAGVPITLEDNNIEDDR